MSFKVWVVAVAGSNFGVYATVHPTEDAAYRSIRETYDIPDDIDDADLLEKAENDNGIEINVDWDYLETGLPIMKEQDA